MAGSVDFSGTPYFGAASSPYQTPKVTNPQQFDLKAFGPQNKPNNPKPNVQFSTPQQFRHLGYMSPPKSAPKPNVRFAQPSDTRNPSAAPGFKFSHIGWSQVNRQTPFQKPSTLGPVNQGGFSTKYKETGSFNKETGEYEKVPGRLSKEQFKKHQQTFKAVNRKVTIKHSRHAGGNMKALKAATGVA